MNAYIWEGKISRRYGSYGWIIVVASTLDEAIAQLREISDASVDWATEAHEWKSAICRNECWSGKDEYSAWTKHYNTVCKTAHNENASIVAAINSHVVIAGGYLTTNPTGSRLTDIDWQAVFAINPKVVSLDHPMILCCYGGYEG